MHIKTYQAFVYGESTNNGNYNKATNNTANNVVNISVSFVGMV